MQRRSIWFALSSFLAVGFLVAASLPALAQDTPPDSTAAGASIFVPAVRKQPAPVCACTAEAASLPANGSVIPNEYIVVLEANDIRAAAGDVVTAEAFAADTVQRYGGELLFTYDSAVEGFAAVLTPEAVAALEANPSVALVEPNHVIRVAPPPDLPTELAPAASTGANSEDLWGLDRIDQRDLSLDGSFTPAFSGAGVHIYVLDTGIRLSHDEFFNRTAGGFTSVNDGNGVNDCYGHGTHVAATAAGIHVGVARSATIHSVRVLDACGSGTDAMVIAGVNWVSKNAIKPAVANMSLGGSRSTAIDIAVRNSILSGVTYVVAAGNENSNACLNSPAGVPAAITVGAVDAGDWRSSYSNVGTCVDIFAPGSRILSAWNSSDTDYAYEWGTSMASPHVAGVAATYLGTKPKATPAQVAAALINSATTGRLSAIDVGSPNRLLFNRFNTAPPFVCTDVILNGGYESGATVWKQSSSNDFELVCSDYECYGAFPRTGAYVGWLAGLNDEVSVLSQRVTVPKNEDAMLSFWYNLISEEFDCDYDVARVLVKSGGKTVREEIMPMCYATSDGIWHNMSIDLSDLAGKTIDVEFKATTNGSNVSNFRVDDVRIRSGESCAVAWSAEEPLPNATGKIDGSAGKSR